MADFVINNDQIATAAIRVANSAGSIVPAPSSDVFVAASSSTSLGVEISTKNGNPVVVMTPMVQASPDITVTVNDSAGLKLDSFVVDIVPNPTPYGIQVDLANSTYVTQAVPTAPGP